MAVIKPFRAIRPAKDKVPFVVSRSYEEYTKKELDSRLRYNPFSFLHIINPGFKFDRRVKGPERFTLVRNRYLEFLEDNILIKDEEPSIYLYEISKDSFYCCGFFCVTSIKDYIDGTIKKHENTIARREKLFADYLDVVGYEAEPVLMTYPSKKSIADIIKAEKEKDPEYYFTTPDRMTHRLWCLKDPAVLVNLESEFEKIDALYIADGHHRSASSKLLSDLRSGGNSDDKEVAHDYFMSYLIPEDEVRIFEFNRMVKDLNGLTKQEFLSALDGMFRIKNHGIELYRPGKKHHFSMYLDGEFYSLYLRKKVYHFTDALSRLDTQILYKTILEPILGIQDLRNDKRIRYGYGKRNVITMKNEIDSGRFQVGFGLVPITMSEIKSIADAGLVMPPKSTYIEPKLRSGLAIYELYSR
ncbi:MAG: DUF1015 domain-containing protein [Flavobacteriaceae bacterium]